MGDAHVQNVVTAVGTSPVEGKKKTGRPAKAKAFSSFSCYEEADVARFLRLVEFEPMLYDRSHALAHRSDLVLQKWDELEETCSFLARRRGQNASRLWTEMLAEYKKEFKRLAELPTGSALASAASQFTYFEHMEFANVVYRQEQVVTAFCSVQREEATESLPAIDRTTRKRKAPVVKIDPIERLVSSVDGFMARSVASATPRSHRTFRHEDLYATIEDAIESVPLCDQFDMKLQNKIRQYVQRLKREATPLRSSPHDGFEEQTWMDI